MIKIGFNLGLLTACVAAFGGCITHEETVVRDKERAKVEFQNESAARIFYETLSKISDSGSHSESNTEMSIVIWDTKRHVVSGPNVKFNQAVAYCDTNKDGHITELEAKIFSEHHPK